MDEASGPLPGESILCVNSCPTKWRIVHVLSGLPNMPSS